MSRRLAASVALGLTVAATAPAVAQVQLNLGQTMVGELSVTDLVWSDGARYDLYTFYGQAGQAVQIDMISTAFDAYLILQDQNGAEVDRNDDGGGNLNARIVRTLAYSGYYRIIAKSLASNRFGAYTIMLQGQGGAMPVATAGEGVRGSVTAGETRSGILTSSDPRLQRGAVYHAYLYTARPGEQITFEVLSSQLDPYAVIQDMQGNALASDDDGGGSLQARLVYTFPAPGSYRLVATTYSANVYGPYSIRVSSNMPGMMMGGTVSAIGTIGLSQQVSGQLTAMDARYDGKPAHFYNFQCIAGQGVQIDILSTWDNYALLLDPAGTVVARDDDGGDVGLNARIQTTCAMTAVYRIGVTTYTASTQPGPYTLQVTPMGAIVQPMMGQAQPMVGQPRPITPVVTAVAPQAAPVAAVPAAGATGQIQMGQTMSGRLETGDRQMSDGTWADVWQFQGLAGQAVTIELRSEEFDTYLQLLDAQGNRLAEDDDSLGNLDSRIVFTLPSSGLFQIVVNSVGDARRAGTYTLTLR